jgi:hypothetical protein
MDDYINRLESQNQELLDRLAEAETIVKQITRKKPVYPVFVMFKFKTGKTWEIGYDMLTVCSNVDEIKKVIKYNFKKGYFLVKSNPKAELIGFKFWRQTVNYNWCLSGMSYYFDLKLVKHKCLTIDEKTGDVINK